MSEPRFAYSDLDALFHAPARLSIATALFTSRAGLSFTELKDACELTDGNLSRHLARLEKDGAVLVEKSFVERRPQTLVCLTTAGRDRFENYLERLREIVETDSREADSPDEMKFMGRLAHE